MRTQPLASLALLSVVTACGPLAPVDNSGGPPPEGSELAFELVSLPGTCGDFQSGASLVKDQATLDAFFASCDIAEESRAQWQTAVNALAEGEAIIHNNVQLGGCLGAFAIQGAFLDDTTVNVWMFRQDFAHGEPNSACTDDLGEGAELIKVVAPGATQATLTIGDFNPDLPGAPQIVLP